MREGIYAIIILIKEGRQINKIITNYRKGNERARRERGREGSDYYQSGAVLSARHTRRSFSDIIQSIIPISAKCLSLSHFLFEQAEHTRHSSNLNTQIMTLFIIAPMCVCILFLS